MCGGGDCEVNSGGYFAPFQSGRISTNDVNTSEMDAYRRSRHSDFLPMLWLEHSPVRTSRKTEKKNTIQNSNSTQQASTVPVQSQEQHTGFTRPCSDMGSSELSNLNITCAHLKILDSTRTSSVSNGSSSPSSTRAAFDISLSLACTPRRPTWAPPPPPPPPSLPASGAVSARDDASIPALREVAAAAAARSWRSSTLHAASPLPSPPLQPFRASCRSCCAPIARSRHRTTSSAVRASQRFGVYT